MNEEKKRALCTRLAEKLPVLRKEMGATQMFFAGLTGLTRSTVFRIEHNKTMSWNTFLSLLMVLTQHEDTMKLMKAMDLFPEELREYLSGRIAPEV